LPKIIDPSVRSQIIKLHLEGKGRNEIAESAGVKEYASSGTVSSVIKKYQDQNLSKSDGTAPSHPSLKTVAHETFAKSKQVHELQTPETTVDLTIEQSIELEKSVNQKRAEKDSLEIEIAELRRDIDSEKLQLEELQKAAQDFDAVKQELARCGISDPSRLHNTVAIFKKYNYSPNAIMNAFAEVQDVIAEKKSIQQLKREIDEQKEVLDRRLEELGFGDFDKLKEILVSLMTLESFGIGVEEIVGISRNLHQHQIRRQQWGPSSSQGWDDAGFINDSNGHGSWGQEYGDNGNGYSY
jgi:hypothetical protein